MSCQKCQSTRIMDVNAKCSDLCMITIGGNDKDGYVPDDVGIGGGDCVDFSLCLDCGQVQGDFPLPKSEIEAELELKNPSGLGDDEREIIEGI